MDRQFVVYIDLESNSSEWWSAARSAPDIPLDLVGVLGPREVYQTVGLSYAHAMRLLAWAEALPGWGADAPHPLAVKEV